MRNMPINDKLKKKAAKKREVIEVVTPIGRLSFPHLAEPDTKGEFSKGEFKCDIMFPKKATTIKELPSKYREWPGWKDSPEVKTLRDAVLKVGRAHFKDPNLSLKDFPNPFKDGDTKNLESFHGNIVMTPKSKFKPRVVSITKEDLSDEQIAAIKGGDYVRLVVRVYGYDTNGGGVSTGLQLVQFMAKGESLGGGREVAVEMLGDVEVDDLEAEDAEEDSSDASDTSDIDDADDADDADDDIDEAPAKKKASAPKSKAPVKRGRPKKAAAPVDDDDDDSEFDDIDAKSDLSDFEL